MKLQNFLSVSIQQLSQAHQATINLRPHKLILEIVIGTICLVELKSILLKGKVVIILGENLLEIPKAEFPELCLLKEEMFINEQNLNCFLLGFTIEDLAAFIDLISKKREVLEFLTSTIQIVTEINTHYSNNFQIPAQKSQLIH